MTAEEFKEKFPLKKKFMDKYQRAYFLVKEVLNINKCEKIVEQYGFTVKRITEHYLSQGILYSEVYFDNKLVATIDLQGFPSIEFHKRKRKFAKMIEADEDVIVPIPTIHRILDWHDVKGKMHCLAGGETVMHVLPVEITEELLIEQIKLLHLEPLIELDK